MGQLLANKGAAFPTRQAYGRVAGLISGQATTLAYMDILSTMALVVVCLTPFVLLMRRPKRAQAQAAEPAH
jgi:hypothetical protein